MRSRWLFRCREGEIRTVRAHAETSDRTLAAGLLLRLTQDGVRIDDCDEKDVRLKPGSGDKAFQVAKVVEAKCRTLEREKFGK